MAYAPNYYNYQVAVIFAIMLGGMLLLALVIGAIYFLCVVNMRNKGKSQGLARANSSGRGGWRPAPQSYPPPQQQYYQPQQPLQQQQQGYSQQPPTPSQLQQQGGEYDPRSNPSPYTAAVQQQYSSQPYYNDGQGPRIRELQPDYAYQQGPITWTTMSPIREDHVHPPQPGTSAGYHMSSV